MEKKQIREIVVSKSFNGGEGFEDTCIDEFIEFLNEAKEKGAKYLKLEVSPYNKECESFFFTVKANHLRDETDGELQAREKRSKVTAAIIRAINQHDSNCG